MARNYYTKNGTVVSNPMNDGNMFISSAKHKRDFMGSVLNDSSSSKEQKAIAGAYCKGQRDGSLSTLKKENPRKYGAVKQKMNRRNDSRIAFKCKK